MDADMARLMRQSLENAIGAALEQVAEAQGRIDGAVRQLEQLARAANKLVIAHLENQEPQEAASE